MYINNLFRVKYASIIFWLMIFCINAQYEKFVESYTLLSTIAGKGEMDISGISGWLPEYENGLAINAELTRPHFAMSDSSGNIYIADKDAHGIRKITPDGKIKTIAGTNIAGFNGDGPGLECMLNAPNGIWVLPSGVVYILDLNNNKVRRLNLNGNIETIVDDKNGIAVGRGLWVNNTEDTIFYASGNQIKIWTINKGIEIYSDGYKALGNIIMDPNGFLVVTDRLDNKVLRISKDGKSKTLIAGNGKEIGGGDGHKATESALYGVRGIWFLPDNSFFVATHEGSQIWYIDTGGIIHLFLNGRKGDEYHSGDGENFYSPGLKISEVRSVSMDNQSNILIVENDKGYVRKIKNEYIYYFTSIIPQQNNYVEVKSFPNPACDHFTIRFRINKAEIIRVKMYDKTGVNVFSTSDFFDAGSNDFHINNLNLSNGIYFYTFSTKERTYTRKLIIYN